MLLNNKLLAKLNDWANLGLIIKARTGGLFNDRTRRKNKDNTV